MKLKTRARLYAFSSSLWITLAFADASLGRYGGALMNLFLGWVFGMFALDFFEKAKSDKG